MNISKVKVTGHLHVWYFKDTMVMGQHISSRTLAYLISQGHNSDGTEHKFKDIGICNKQKHNSYRIYLQVKDLCMFIQQFILQCPWYTILHTSTTIDAGIASPTDHRGGTSRQLLQTVPSSCRSWDFFFPWPEKEAPTDFPEDYKCTVAESPTECQLKKTAPTTREQDKTQVKSMQMNIQSNEHFTWTFLKCN